MTSQEVTTMATTFAKETTASVEHAARLEHVSKSFATPGGQQLVLDDITIDVAPGEFGPTHLPTPSRWACPPT